MAVRKKLLLSSLGLRGRVCFRDELRVVPGRKKAEAPLEQLLVQGRGVWGSQDQGALCSALADGPGPSEP